MTIDNEEIPIINIKKDDGTFVQAILLTDLEKLLKISMNDLPESKNLRYVG